MNDRLPVNVLFLVLFFFSLNASGFDHFITRKGYQLMDGDEVFRFLSFNIPNLNFVEDEMTFERTHPFDLPTAYEIRDAMESVQQMNGHVIRTYTIPVRRETDTPDVPRYVLAPGTFDEHAFATMDTMLALANETGVRLIVPLLNAWKWMGGRPQYAGFRGKTEEEFWTDPRLIDDFKKTIAFVINRINTVSGIRYRDDKSILCWETGNELPCPHSWTQTITRYIKELDPNHLVMDGYGAGGRRLVREESLAEPAVDIVSSHHYERSPEDVIQNIEANRRLVQGKKVYVIGEFGFLGTPGLCAIMDYIVRHDDVAGGLIWSLRYHRHEGGFYWHSEPLGFGLYKAYHWPGFRSGDEYDETNLLAAMRGNAFAIQGKAVPPVPPPGAPLLLPVSDVAAISWQGSAGASCYDVERADTPDGPWTIVGYNISDAAVPYRPLFHDASAELHRDYFYRVTAKNPSGKSPPSNVAGPVTVREQAVIDEMENLMIAWQFRNRFSFKSEEDRKFREDLVRLEGTAENLLIYRTPGPMTRIRIYAFAEAGHPTLKTSVSRDNHDYAPLDMKRTGYFGGSGDYAYWHPVLYETGSVTGAVRFIKIEFLEKTQISRIELYYSM